MATAGWVRGRGPRPPPKWPPGPPRIYDFILFVDSYTLFILFLYFVYTFLYFLYFCLRVGNFSMILCDSYKQSIKKYKKSVTVNKKYKITGSRGSWWPPPGGSGATARTTSSEVNWWFPGCSLDPWWVIIKSLIRILIRIPLRILIRILIRSPITTHRGAKESPWTTSSAANWLLLDFSWASYWVINKLLIKILIRIPIRILIRF